MNCKPLMSGSALIEIERSCYDELLKTEAKFDFVKKFLASKTSFNNYVDVTDLLLLLDIKKERKERKNEQ